MANHTVAVTGMGVITPTGVGVEQFAAALREGRTNFSCLEIVHNNDAYKFPIGKTEEFDFQQRVSGLHLEEELINKAKRLRNISPGVSYGVFCALEAWANAGLNKPGIDLERVAIVSAGTNTQQASLYSTQEKYRGKLQFLPPQYGFSFFDSDIIGVLSELLSVKGEGFVTGAASASGNMAIIQGHRLISSSEYDVVLVLAPLMELSVYEFQGFISLGAMAQMTDGAGPSELCRPFDTGHRGFVYGQSAGCLIIESAKHAAKRGIRTHGTIAGYGVSLDANRNPNPSVQGEQKAMQAAMRHAQITPKQVNYVNTHGTASKIGDETEVSALLGAGLKGVNANSTKSLIGHGLSAAGLVECIASLIQMENNFMHQSHNLINPISEDINWIRDVAQPAEINYAINNSFGFGGINTSIILKK
ncbi:MAG: beta-ketoacyl synthase N-terminal-like domain-containing protein [Chitinophagaceae bacterium]